MRTTNRILSAVLGLVLIVVGLTVAIEMALIAAGRNPVVLPLDRWYAWMTTTTLDDSRVLATAIVVGLIGVVLLILGFRPWPPDRLLAGEPQDKTWWVSRRSVERRTATAAATAAGVHQAHADVRGRSRNSAAATARGGMARAAGGRRAGGPSGADPSQRSGPDSDLYYPAPAAREGRVNAANRGLWIAIGVLLTAAGVVGVLASQGWLGIGGPPSTAAHARHGRAMEWLGHLGDRGHDRRWGRARPARVPPPAGPAPRTGWGLDG